MPEHEAEEHARPVVTRRDFIAGAGLGVAATAIVAGGVTVATRQGVQTVPAPQPVAQTGAGGAVVAPAPAPGVAAQPQAVAQPAAPAAGALPQHMRRVTLDIDGAQHNVVVDVRESLWTTTSQKLGLNVTNLGCDRAQCGACTVVIDGRAVNGCSVFSARLGRGQVASLRGEAGLEQPGLEEQRVLAQAGFEHLLSPDLLRARQQRLGAAQP